MERSNHEFDLSSFIVGSLCLHENISPYTKNQFQKIQEDPALKLLEADPREVIGFNSICKPMEIPENTTGTPIQEFYRGLNIFITGGTGFLGKILTEKLIRSIPHLGKIYVLLREKKGVSAAERFEKLLEDEVFLRMRTEVPNYKHKLTYIEGDITQPDLGLREADRQTLQDQVHVVFHSAADVQFINTLRAAVNSNFFGSQRVIDLAKGMKNLKFGRWSFLLAGIAYGAFWQSRYEKYELSIKDHKLKEKADRDARIAYEKNLAAQREIEELEKIGKGSK